MLRLTLACTILTAAANQSMAAELPSEDAFQKWGSAETLFVAKLEKADAGPVARSLPPIYTFRLHFTVDSSIRGQLPMGEKLTASYSARQMEPPTFPLGKRCVVATETSRGTTKVTAISEATPEQMQVIRAISAIPLGWQLQASKLNSPWSKLPNAKWTGGEEDGMFHCAATGRPTWAVGRDVKFTVEKVPPAKEIKWTNPDGDGLYKITLTNTSDADVQIPALRQKGDKVLWDSCLAIICQSQSYPIPGTDGAVANSTPVTLAPGKSISHVVNALQLEGPTWPRGGYRIAFQFCLGEKSATESFYYLSRHHDKVREEALKQLKSKP